jgi:UDP-N-acetyl-D-mannosaminuronate dehydrogenase
LPNTAWLTIPALNAKNFVMGLGYVGLPLAVALAKHSQVIGLDHEQSPG